MSTVGDNAGATAATMSRQLVVFSLAGEECALPIASVSEIIRHTMLRSVASDTPNVQGVIGLRGKIIPIVDLATRLGLPRTRAEAGESDKIVILDADGSKIGICVDQVDEVLSVPSDRLEVVPTAGSAVEAIAKLDNRLVMLLDAASLHADAPTSAARFAR